MMDLSIYGLSKTWDYGYNMDYRFRSWTHRCVCLSLGDFLGGAVCGCILQSGSSRFGLSSR